jgi:hypothetical protein
VQEAIDTDYDGFYFLPTEEDNELQLAYFKLNDEHRGDPVIANSIGDIFHVAFFRKGADGMPEFDEEFEAVFSDPRTYVKNLIGANLFGTFLRKTQKSGEFWKEYLDEAKNKCSISKVKTTVESIFSVKK